MLNQCDIFEGHRVISNNRDYYYGCIGTIIYTYEDSIHIEYSVVDVSLDDHFTPDGRNKVISFYVKDLQLNKIMNRNGANTC